MKQDRSISLAAIIFHILNILQAIKKAISLWPIAILLARNGQGIGRWRLEIPSLDGGMKGTRLLSIHPYPNKTENLVLRSALDGCRHRFEPNEIDRRRRWHQQMGIIMGPMIATRRTGWANYRPELGPTFPKINTEVSIIAAHHGLHAVLPSDLD